MKRTQFIAKLERPKRQVKYLIPYFFQGGKWKKIKQEKLK